MTLEVSSLIGYSAIAFLSGYASGKVFAFVESYIKRATGTY